MTRSPRPPHPTRLLAILLAALAVLPACAPATSGAPTPAAPATRAPAAGPTAPVAAPTVRWLALTLAGEPVGRAREQIEPLADGGFATRTMQELRMGRLGRVIEFSSEVDFDEDRAGRLRAVRMRLKQSRQETATDVALTERTATVREAAGDKAHTRTVAVTEPLLGPEAIRRAVATRLRTPGDTLAYITWSPTLSAPQRVTCTAEASETRAIDGAPRPLLRAKVVGEGEPPRTAWFDGDGREVSNLIELPFGAMITTVARAEPAMPSGEMPSDVFARTLIRANVRLPRARSLEKLTLEVRLGTPAQGMVIDSADVRVVRREPTALVVEVARVAAPARAASAASADAVVGPEFLAPNLYIDPTDAEVAEIARAATAGATDPWESAQRLTRWVTEHMAFDAGILFAPAAELARDRRGTCAGYAVLLASLLRAGGIPSRLVMGLVYVGGVFGGHAWVEAHVGGRWIPLDAAVPSAGPADAARIAVARDALDQGTGAMFNAFSEIAAAKLRVLAYTPAGGAPVQADAAVAPYTIDGHRYANRGLGLSIDAPPGYRFTTMDAVWPDRTFVALEGPGGRVTLEEGLVWPGRDPAEAAARALELAGPGACRRATIAGRPACGVRRDGAAGLAFADGPTLFIVQAKGPDAARLLDTVARTVRLDGRGTPTGSAAEGRRGSIAAAR